MENVIQRIMDDRGIADVTDDLLEKKLLGMSKKRLRNILRNKTVMTYPEAAAFADWLGIPVEHTHEEVYTLSQKNTQLA